MEFPTLKTLGLIGLEGLGVLAFEALWIPAFQHSFGLWLGWYVAYLLLTGAFFVHSYMLLIASELYRKRMVFLVWAFLLLVVAVRVIKATEQFVELLKPLAR